MPKISELIAAGVLTGDELVEVTSDPAGTPVTRRTTVLEVGQVATNAHTTDATDAHNASAILVEDVAGRYTAADVEAALAEVKAVADDAAPSSSLSTVATSGRYGDLQAVPPRRIFETAAGVWTADAPADRTDYQHTVEFIGPDDPTDVTNGIVTPANIVAGDRWTQTTDYVS